MQKYVLGFAFSNGGENIVLIEKQKPDWQKDFLNGIGGKVEKGESSKNAMVREFREETGVETNSDDWDYFAKLKGDTYEMNCFRIYTDDVYKAATMEGETVSLLGIDTAFQSGKLIHSLQVLLPMALDKNFKFSDILHSGKD
jgi:8-oxo-dGTP diphosphatase